jgi:hypothetical protein
MTEFMEFATVFGFIVNAVTIMKLFFDGSTSDDDRL